jgi:hypothetical protein
VKKKQATESCLRREAFPNSSRVQMQLQQPSKFAMTWARPRSDAAAKPSLKAWLLGPLHSNINSTLTCFTCLRKKLKRLSYNIKTILTCKFFSAIDRMIYMYILCFVQFLLQCQESRQWHPLPRSTDKWEHLLTWTFFWIKYGALEISLSLSLTTML